MRKTPALADLTDAKGRQAIDLACLECREAMQRGLLFFLDRYAIADGPPEHRSATSLVVRAVDHAATTERKVVIKIFQNEEEWRNEKNSRNGLDARYVVQTIEAPGDDKFKQELQTYGLFKNKDRFGKRIGSRAIVMDAADLNLFQIYQTERPDLNAVRVLMHPRRTLQGTQFDAHRARAALR